MKVCIDIQSVIANRTGVGRYTCELVKALSKIVNKGDITLSYFNFLGRYEGLDYFQNKQIKFIPGRLYNQLWKKFHFPPLNWFIGDYDVYHFPNFCLPPMNHGKYIITVHDLAFMRYPEYIEPKNLKFLLSELPRSLEEAHRIIAVSNFTKNELVELFKIPKEKVVVIYEGVSHGNDVRPSSNTLPSKYILCVSTIEPRKNIDGLIKAFHLCKLKDYKLVIAGKKGWKVLLKQEKDVIYLGYVPEDELYDIYRRASAFVFPSFYEGFGLPPLEAMANFVPVVSTRFEVLGDAARFINPKDPQDIADGIMEALENPEKWIKKAVEQAKKFTWEKTAEETLRLYESCNRL